MRTAIGWAMALTVMVLMMATPPLQAQGRANDDVVITSGEGVVKRAPDRAFVTVVAESRARQPKLAQQANATAMTAVLERLKALGFTGDTVRTLSFGVEPEYDWSTRTQVLKGYVARNVVEVRIDDIGRVGEVVDSAVESGATQVRNVRFTLKDMATVEREALSMASADALARARALAEGVGRAVDRVVKLDEVGEASPGPVMMQRMGAPMAAAEAAPSTPVAAGEIEVQSRVTLTAVLK
jgi:uncharacterized protein YggE